MKAAEPNEPSIAVLRELTNLTAQGAVKAKGLTWS